MTTSLFSKCGGVDYNKGKNTLLYFMFEKNDPGIFIGLFSPYSNIHDGKNILSFPGRT